MSLKGFFEGVESLFVDVLFMPLDAFRELELESWFMANGINWLFLIIGFVAFFYWMKQLKMFNENGEEDRSSTSHSYLG
ncbi:MAG TPA: uracil phosphoribosyltransferase [Flavobacteriaceae bacterium]|nr:uracil phosphoribosyltransferase [Flavobacteriaceae bacterium]